MNILTTYFSASCFFTFVCKGTMYVEFNSVTLCAVLYTRFVNCTKDVSKSLRILESLLYISVERYFYNTAVRLCKIKVHSEIAEKSQLNDKCFLFIVLGIYASLFHILSLNMDLFNSQSNKMMDNKSKTSFIMHIQKKYHS